MGDKVNRFRSKFSYLKITSLILVNTFSIESITQGFETKQTKKIVRK